MSQARDFIKNWYPATNKDVKTPFNADGMRTIFEGFRVFVLPGASAGVVAMLASRKFRKAPSYVDCDLVVFTGGVDVNPKLYGEEPRPNGYYDNTRDELEAKVFASCVTNKIPMLGICRGAQFLHVMNGGSLWQHVDNHTKPHGVIDVETGEVFAVSSTHHQALRHNPEMTLLCTTIEQTAQNFYGEGRTGPQQDHIEVEAAVYNDTMSFCVQGHPEHTGFEPFTEWMFDKLAFYYLEWDATDGLLNEKTSEIVPFIGEEAIEG